MMPTKTVERAEYDKAKAAARLACTLAYRRADAAYRTAMEEALRAYKQVRAEKGALVGRGKARPAELAKARPRKATA